MPFVAVQGLNLVQVQDFPVDTDLGIALAAEPFEEFAVMAFAASDKRREQKALAAFVVLHDQVYDLLIGVTDHLDSGYRRIGGGGTGIKKTQEIGYLRYRAHGRAWIVAGSLLLNRDDGT